MNSRDLSAIDMDFEAWLEKSLQGQQSLPLHVRIAELLGIAVGILSSPIMYVLAAEFPDEIYSALGIEDNASLKVLEVVFGVLAVLPMAGLAALATHASFKKFAMPKDQSSSIDGSKLKTAKNIALAAAYILGLFSAIPQSSLTWERFPGYWKYILTPNAIVGPLFFNADSLVVLVEQLFKYFNRGENEQIRQHREELCTNIFKAQLGLMDAGDNEIERIYDMLFPAKAPSESQETLPILSPAAQGINADTKSALRELFLLAKQVDIESMSKCHTVSSYGFAGFGSIIGILGTFTYFNIASSAIDSFCNWANILNNSIARGFIKYPIASLAFIPNATLGEWRTREAFKKVYDHKIAKQPAVAASNWPKIRNAILYSALIIGVFAAIPLASIQLEDANDYIQDYKDDASAMNMIRFIISFLLVIPVFASPYFVRSNALQRSGERLLNQGDSLLANSSLFAYPQKIKTRKEKLIEVTQSIGTRISELSDDSVEQLHSNYLA